MFDQRELKFEVGDGESLGFPPGVEKAIMAMEEEEEALFILKPKYGPFLVSPSCFCLFLVQFVSLSRWDKNKISKHRLLIVNLVMKPCHLLEIKRVRPQRAVCYC